MQIAFSIQRNFLHDNYMNKYLQESFSWRYEMKGNCLTVSVRRRKTVLMDGTELSQEMMWGGENLKRATKEGGDFIEALINEMKVLADEIDQFLEVSPDIAMICRLAKNYLFYCQKNSNGFTS